MKHDRVEIESSSENSDHGDDEFNIIASMLAGACVAL